MQTCVQAGIEAGHVQRGSAGCLCGDFPSLPLHVHMLFCTFLTRSSKEALSPQGSSYPSCALLRNELLLSSMIYKLLHTPPKKNLSLILQL